MREDADLGEEAERKCAGDGRETPIAQQVDAAGRPRRGLGLWFRLRRAGRLRLWTQVFRRQSP
jgi:hypothetical protein